jgi:hypothetical protein
VWKETGFIAKPCAKFLIEHDVGLATCRNYGISTIVRNNAGLPFDSNVLELQEQEHREHLEVDVECIDQQLISMHITAEGARLDPSYVEKGPEVSDTEKKNEVFANMEDFFEIRFSDNTELRTTSVLVDESQPADFTKILQHWVAAEGLTFSSIDNLLSLMHQHQPALNFTRLPKHAKNLVKVS